MASPASVNDELQLPKLFAEYGRTLIIRPNRQESHDEFFDRICNDFSNTKIEQHANGDVWIMPPAGGESSNRNGGIVAQLFVWAVTDRRGRAFDSSALFLLPDRSKLGPDAAWIRNKTLATLTPLERKKFLRLTPEFVIELKSPSDSLPALQRKMQKWMRNGVALGWLIVPEKRQVYVYMPEQELKKMEFKASTLLAAEGIMEGFVLDLQPVWQGLSEL